MIKDVNKYANENEEQIKDKKIPKLNTKQQTSLEKTIFNQTDTKKRSILDFLKVLYKSMGDVKEAYDIIKSERKLLTDDEILKLMDLVYTIYRKNSIKESLILEVNTQLDNNIITQAWVKLKKPQDKRMLIKILKSDS